MENMKTVIIEMMVVVVVMMMMVMMMMPVTSQYSSPHPTVQYSQMLSDLYITRTTILSFFLAS